jgi:hypothetical protein
LQHAVAKQTKHNTGLICGAYQPPNTEPILCHPSGTALTASCVLTS